MVLTVIIVNYNTKYFLEQCLCSLRKAIGNSDRLSLSGNSEIFVVDNYSIDGTVQYIQPMFPEIIFIANSENRGFARANNQALAKARGQFILFLNPDTILEEESLEKCLVFLESHPLVAATGVRMVDGAGHFLQESKRGFPSPWVSFCKLSGLTGLFPRSKFFAAYYQGQLKEELNNPVEVLSGAFMMIQKKALDKTGGFDEQFFMYAEDIDLSYRLQKAGYQNVYLASVSIVHFKGESTKKNAVYVELFYKAMVQFVKKHFRGRPSKLFIPLLEAAAWLRSRIARLTPGPVRGSNRVRKDARTILLGDNKQMNRLKNLFPLAGRMLVQDLNTADEIIFCEGEDFSFGRIIREMQLLRPGLAIRIHAANSKSIVGSDSKKSMGEITALNENG